MDDDGDDDWKKSTENQPAQRMQNEREKKKGQIETVCVAASVFFFH